MFAYDGRYDDYDDGECVLFPSKENRDWSTFKVEPKFPTGLIDSQSIINDNNSNPYIYCVTLNTKFDILRQLVIHRDAWWKVDGDWKPDWEVYSQDKYYITSYKNSLKISSCNSFNLVLVFRTKEIRDKFLETFRDLIEQCKELI